MISGCLVENPSDRLSIDDLNHFLTHPNLIVCRQTKKEGKEENLLAKVLEQQLKPVTLSEKITSPERRGRKKEESKQNPDPINFTKFL